MTPLRMRLIVTFVAMMPWIASCAFQSLPHNPFAVSADSLFDGIKTIASAPVSPTGDLTMRGDAVTRLEKALEEGLERAGFRVVPVFEYIGTWQHIADGHAGFYDPLSGERDDEAYEAAMAQMRRDLRERFKADGVLFPELWEGPVPFVDGVASWDGASQAVFGAYGLSGEVRAMSLVLVIEDLVGTELFAGGFGFATIEAWHNGEWLPLVLDAVVGDARLVSTAVAGALAPLFDARMADSSQTP